MTTKAECEWDWSKDSAGWLAGCSGVLWFKRGKYCPDCSLPVWAQTTEQKLEAMTLERDRQRARANGALFDLRQAGKHLAELVQRAASTTNTYADERRDWMARAVHLPECGTHRHIDGDPRACTCGLQELLNRDKP